MHSQKKTTIYLGYINDINDVSTCSHVMTSVFPSTDEQTMPLIIFILLMLLSLNGTTVIFAVFSFGERAINSYVCYINC